MPFRRLLYNPHKTCYPVEERGVAGMLGEQIAALRRKRGLSQKELAARLGISASTVGMYEQNRRKPPLNLLPSLAGLLGVGTAQLLSSIRGPQEAACTPEDLSMMRQALALAREAAAEGEVPVGCVIAKDGVIVGRGRNRRESARHALAHAELEAIDQACRTLGGWRLWQCTLYVTLEPCPMCAGAILNARIPRVLYGAGDPKAGACGSVCDLFCMSFNHHPQAARGLLETECSQILHTFFQDLRARRNEERSAADGAARGEGSR